MATITTTTTKPRLFRWIGLALLLLLLGGALLFYFWARDAAPATAAARDAMQSTASVAVSIDDDLATFEPLTSNENSGVIIYPGALVDFVAYSAIAHDLANEGYTVFIAEMPLNFAFFDINRAAEIIEANPTIETWTMAGHSLGGVMAGSFGMSREDIDAISYWASYPASSSDYTNSDKAFNLIYGTLDGLATVAEVDEARDNLPANTVYVPIEGGNHAQFGYYGPQNGDLPATISAESQQGQIVDAMLALLESID